MRGGAVIALQIVLKHELPVRIDLIRLTMSNLGVRQIVSAQGLTNIFKRAWKSEH